MKYQAVVNIAGTAEYTIQAPCADELAGMLGIITGEEWGGDAVNALCVDNSCSHIRLDVCVVFFSKVER